MAKYMRKRFFIDKKIQTKYIILTILLLLIYTFLFAVILFLPYIIPLSFDYPIEEQTKAARMLLNLHQSVWPALGAVILIMSTLSIFITHKIAGPVYRFKKDLAEVSAGNLDITIRLREKDDLKDLAEDLNLMIKELRVFVNTLQGNDQAMLSCVNELEDQIKNNKISSEAGRELIDTIQENRANIAQVLEKYTKD